MMKADWQNHHIEGYARAALERGINGNFSVNLITLAYTDPDSAGQLWQGGCIHGVSLPDFLDLVVSLYPWERFELADNTMRIEVEAYDSPDQDPTLFKEIADLIAKEIKEGKTVLVHCQAGLNRSGLVASLVLREFGFTSKDAIQLLRDKRSPVVLCNESFENWLLSLDEEEN